MRHRNDHHLAGATEHNGSAAVLVSVVPRRGTRKNKCHVYKLIGTYTYKQVEELALSVVTV